MITRAIAEIVDENNLFNLLVAVNFKLPDVTISDNLENRFDQVDYKYFGGVSAASETSLCVRGWAFRGNSSALDQPSCAWSFPGCFSLARQLDVHGSDIDMSLRTEPNGYRQNLVNRGLDELRDGSDPVFWLSPIF